MSSGENEQQKVVEKLKKCTDLFAEFATVGERVQKATQDGDVLEVTRGFIRSSRVARKIADAFVEYADSVEELFEL